MMRREFMVSIRHVGCLFYLIVASVPRLRVLHIMGHEKRYLQRGRPRVVFYCDAFNQAVMILRCCGARLIVILMVYLAPL